ncbi:ankyrin repeat domain-containing protein, partial [bacterium]
LTPLFIASQEGHKKIVQILLAAKADVNYAIKYGWTSLLVASSAGNTKIVQLLINVKADINKADINGVTPLYIASQKDHREIVQLLINANTNNGKTSRRKRKSKTKKRTKKNQSNAGQLPVEASKQEEDPEQSNAGQLPVEASNQEEHSEQSNAGQLPVEDSKSEGSSFKPQGTTEFKGQQEKEKQEEHSEQSKAGQLPVEASKQEEDPKQSNAGQLPVEDSKQEEDPKQSNAGQLPVEDSKQEEDPKQSNAGQLPVEASKSEGSSFKPQGTTKVTEQQKKPSKDQPYFFASSSCIMGSLTGSSETLNYCLDVISSNEYASEIQELERKMEEIRNTQKRITKIGIENKITAYLQELKLEMRENRLRYNASVLDLSLCQQKIDQIKIDQKAIYINLGNIWQSYVKEGKGYVTEPKKEAYTDAMNQALSQLEPLEKALREQREKKFKIECEKFDLESELEDLGNKFVEMDTEISQIKKQLINLQNKLSMHDKLIKKRRLSLCHAKISEVKKYLDSKFRDMQVEEKEKLKDFIFEIKKRKCNISIFNDENIEDAIMYSESTNTMLYISSRMLKKLMRANVSEAVYHKLFVKILQRLDLLLFLKTEVRLPYQNTRMRTALEFLLSNLGAVIQPILLKRKKDFFPTSLSTHYDPRNLEILQSAL